MKEWKTYLLALLSLVIIILLLKNCSDNKGYENEISNLNDKLVKQEAELKTIIQKDSSKLYVMEQKLMGERHARILAEDTSKRFKTLSAVIKTKVEVRRDTIWVPFADSSLTYFNDTIDIPLAYADKWFYLGGKMQHNGLLLDSIGFKPGYVNVLVGEQ